MLMEGREFEAIYRRNAEQERLLTLFRPTPASKILEIGSGGGRWGTFFGPRAGSFVGLDISPKMVSVAEKERARLGLANVRYECLDMLDFRTEERFDLVYFSGVLQYMDDEIVRRCLSKADELLSDGGTVVTRDSVQKSVRVEKIGEYPVIYRTEAEYRSYFEAAGFTQTYSGLSYAHKRFTKTASRLFRLSGVTYGMAYAVREALCLVDDLLGNPPFMKTGAHLGELKAENPQEHRFSRYVRSA